MKFEVFEYGISGIQNFVFTSKITPKITKFRPYTKNEKSLKIVVKTLKIVSKLVSNEVEVNRPGLITGSITTLRIT